MLLLLQFLHVLVEPLEVLVPILLESDDPFVDRLKAARVERVEPLLPGLADAHESHFAKHAQVLRRARLRDPQCTCKLVDGTLAPFEKDENPPPLRLGNRVERIRGRGGSCHEPKICPYRHMSISKARDRDFDALFTADRPVIFAYHGYPWRIHRLAYRRTNHQNLHVRGYKEEGTTTTPFDMVMLNDLGRFHLAMDVIDRVPGLGERAGDVRQLMQDRRMACRAYTREHGEDAPEITQWAWAPPR